MLEEALKRLKEMKQELEGMTPESRYKNVSVTLHESGIFFSYNYDYRYVPGRDTQGVTYGHKPSEETGEAAFEKFKEIVKDFVKKQSEEKVKQLALMLIKHAPEATAGKLRLEGFEDDELKLWAAAAAAKAQELVDAGPFEVIWDTAKSNGAPAVELEDDGIPF